MINHPSGESQFGEVGSGQVHEAPGTPETEEGVKETVIGQPWNEDVPERQQRFEDIERVGGNLRRAVSEAEMKFDTEHIFSVNLMRASFEAQTNLYADVPPKIMDRAAQKWNFVQKQEQVKPLRQEYDRLIAIANMDYLYAQAPLQRAFNENRAHIDELEHKLSLLEESSDEAMVINAEREDALKKFAEFTQLSRECEEKMRVKLYEMPYQKDKWIEEYHLKPLNPDVKATGPYFNKYEE